MTYDKPSFDAGYEAGFKFGVRAAQRARELAGEHAQSETNIFTRSDLFGFPIPEHKRKCLFGVAFPCNATCHTVRKCHWAENARQAAESDTPGNVANEPDQSRPLGAQ